MIINFILNKLFRHNLNKICCISSVHNEERYLPGFLSHIRNYVDGFIFFNDRSNDKTSQILSSNNVIEIRHSIVNISNNEYSSAIEVFRCGKWDKTLSSMAKEVIDIIFSSGVANFILPPPSTSSTQFFFGTSCAGETHHNKADDCNHKYVSDKDQDPFSQQLLGNVLTEASQRCLYYNEKLVRQFLVLFARKLGYKVALCCDADERFESNFLKNLHKISREITGKKICYGLHFRELWGDSSHYRVDGVWGRKQKFILFPLIAGNYTFSQTMRHNIHTFWHPDQLHSLFCLPYNLYHLKMITEEERIRRSKLYNSLDPNRKIQTIGYDYLIDTKSIELEPFKPENYFNLQ